MSRPSIWPPQIRVKNGTAYCRFQAGGVRHFITLGPAGSAKATAAYRRILDAHPDAPPAPAPDITVAEVCARWIATAPQRYRPDSREPGEFELAMGPLLALYQDSQAATFGPKALKAVRQRMVDGGLSRGVANRRTVRLKTLFKWAVEEELVPGPVYAALQAVRAIPPHAPGVRSGPGCPTATWDQVKRVYRECSRVVGAMILVQWFTGMRSQEVRLLRPVDVQVDGKPLFSDDSARIQREFSGNPVSTSTASWVYRPHKHKNLWRNQPREVPFGPRAVAVLRRWLKLCPRPDAYVFRPELGGPRARAKKDHYTDSAYGLAVARAAERAGVVPFRPYATRHGCKRVVERAAGTEAARAILGQKTIDSTQLYGGLDLELATEVARRLG